MCRTAEELGIRRVGLFVDAPVALIQKLLAECPLDVLQLHGSESPQDLAAMELFGLPLVKAIRLPLGRIEPDAITHQIAPWLPFASAGGTFLFDAQSGGQLGGTGERLDWQSIGIWAAQNPSIRWVLAGGLNPENVALAVEQSKAAAVDVASGVEGERGVKSAERVRAFVNAARSALKGLSQRS